MNCGRNLLWSFISSISNTCYLSDEVPNFGNIILNVETPFHAQICNSNYVQIFSLLKEVYSNILLHCFFLSFFYDLIFNYHYMDKYLNILLSVLFYKTKNGSTKIDVFSQYYKLNTSTLFTHLSFIKKNRKE